MYKNKVDMLRISRWVNEEKKPYDGRVVSIV